MKKYMWYRLFGLLTLLLPVTAIIAVVFYDEPPFLIGKGIIASIIGGGWLLRESIKAKNEYLENEYLRKKNYGNTTIDN